MPLDSVPCISLQKYWGRGHLIRGRSLVMRKMRKTVKVITSLFSSMYTVYGGMVFL